MRSLNPMRCTICSTIVDYWFEERGACEIRNSILKCVFYKNVCAPCVYVHVIVRSMSKRPITRSHIFQLYHTLRALRKSRISYSGNFSLSLSFDRTHSQQTRPLEVVVMHPPKGALNHSGQSNAGEMSACTKFLINWQNTKWLEPKAQIWS